MEEKILLRALNMARSVRDWYEKILNDYQQGNLEAVENKVNDLKFVLEVEKKIYNLISFKDIKKYEKILLRKNPELQLVDYGDLILNEVYLDPFIRVYMRLVYKKQVENYSGEFNLEMYDEEISYGYLKEKIMREVLYYLLQYENNKLFWKVKLNLAFSFPDFE